jgi:hypothetical protein
MTNAVNLYFKPSKRGLLAALAAIPGTKIIFDKELNFRYIIERDGYQVSLRTIESAGRIHTYKQLWDEYHNEQPQTFKDFALRYVIWKALQNVKDLPEVEDGKPSKSKGRKARAAVVDS